MEEMPKLGTLTGALAQQVTGMLSAISITMRAALYLFVSA